MTARAPSRIERHQDSSVSATRPSHTLTTCGWVKKGLPLCLIADSGTGSPTCPGFGRLTETFPQVKPWRTHP